VPMAAPAKVARLAPYDIDPKHVYVAGFSSGAFMAVQMHVAHSSTFKGAAIYAGGVYWCAEQGGEFELEDDCARYYESHLHASEKYLDRQSRLGTIDPKINLRDQPVYLFSGKLDIAVVQAEMDDLNAEYQHYGAKTAYDNAFVATHGWESPDGENSCIQGGLPFTIRCFKDGSLYDSEQTWLTMFLGKLKPRSTGSLTGSLINFDQTKFGASYSNSMDTNGYVYVPHSCAAGKRCSLVVILHGCTMTQANEGTKFITEGNVVRWADTNRIVALYPFLVPNPSFNPTACWDIWGYGGANYALRSATQTSIVYAMVRRITGRK
jgi:poly(3-hydroxybutyrate) depolymerase